MIHLKKLVCVTQLLASLVYSSQGAIPTSYPTGPGPTAVTLGSDGTLVYAPDSSGDTIPDFSNCGYGGGGVPIPNIPVWTNLTAISGDNSSRIQQAINALSAQ